VTYSVGTTSALGSPGAVAQASSASVSRELLDK
jgi:hypothetical protein